MEAAHVEPGAYKDVVLFLATAGVVVPLFRRWKISPILGFLGEEFRAGFWPLAIMATSLLLNLFTATSSVMLSMAHREDIFRQLTIASLLLSVLCIVLLVPAYGMLGTAISVALGVAIREGGSYIAARRIIPGHALSGVN